MSEVPHRAFPVVLAAPSGTGKTTIARALVDSSPRFVFSVSVTTRPPRERERPGADYHFVSEAGFRSMREGGELAEWAEVHGQLYGTPLSELRDAAERGQHAVLDIDVEGARQIRRAVPEAVLVFVLPPTGSELVRRLTRRGTEKDEEVRRRLRGAMEELERANEFDFVLVNRDLSEAVRTVRKIVAVEALRASRAADLRGRIQRLRQEVEDFLDGELGGA